MQEVWCIIRSCQSCMCCLACLALAVACACYVLLMPLVLLVCERRPTASAATLVARCVSVCCGTPRMQGNTGISRHCVVWHLCKVCLARFDLRVAACCCSGLRRIAVHLQGLPQRVGASCIPPGPHVCVLMYGVANRHSCLSAGLLSTGTALGQMPCVGLGAVSLRESV